MRCSSATLARNPPCGPGGRPRRRINHFRTPKSAFGADEEPAFKTGSCGTTPRIDISVVPLWRRAGIGIRVRGEQKAASHGLATRLTTIAETRPQNRPRRPVNHPPGRWSRPEGGGRGGIRTHGELAPTAVFKTAALSRSATLPVDALADAVGHAGLEEKRPPEPRPARPKAPGPTAGAPVLRAARAHSLKARFVPCPKPERLPPRQGETGWPRSRRIPFGADTAFCSPRG